MTDRELLEKAAKAAGMGAVKESSYRPGSFVARTHENEWTAWNPITDDGDALRLAVKLKLTINPYQDGVFVSRYEGEEVVAEPFEVMGQPDAPATRRAIVRAAAAMAE